MPFSLLKKGVSQYFCPYNECTSHWCLVMNDWLKVWANNKVPYYMFRRSFKEKCALSDAKTEVQYVNPGTFLLCWCRYGSSEFKYPGTVAKNECSIMLEICPTPNPTLNRQCWQMQNRYKHVFVDATMLFELPYIQIWNALSNRSYTGFEPVLVTSQVRLRTLWATEQTYRLWKTHRN